MNLKGIAVAAALFLAGMAAPAMAQQVTAKDPASVEAALKAAGYPVTMMKDNSGDPMIRSQSEGINFMIAFYGCKENKNCTTVSMFTAFSAATKPTPAKINDWNKQRRFGRVYTDDEGDPVIQFEVDLDDGGMSRELFIDNIEWFIVASASVRETLTK